MKIYCSARLAAKVVIVMLFTGLLLGFCVGLGALGSSTPSAQNGPSGVAPSASAPSSHTAPSDRLESSERPRDTEKFVLLHGRDGAAR
jgi:hypothetical protein